MSRGVGRIAQVRGPLGMRPDRPVFEPSGLLSRSHMRGLTALSWLALGASMACGFDRSSDQCEIVAEPVAQVGEAGEDGSFSSYPSVSPILGDGFILGASVRGSGVGPIMRFDARGRYLGPLGGLGDGPGDYRRPELFLPYRGDSALVFDQGAQRVVVLDRTGTAARTMPLPALPGPQGNAVALDDGVVVLSDNGFGRAQPLHTFRADGSPIARFGPPGAAPSRQVATGQVVARSGPDRFWATNNHADYWFIEWAVDGTLLREFHATREWITPGAPMALATPTAPRSPTLTGAWQDDAGRLWVTGMVSDPKWQRGLGPPVRLEGHEVYPITDHRLADDGIVDVIDTATGASIASRRFDEIILQAPAPGLITLAWETEDGWWKAALMRVGLRGSCGG